MSAIQVQSPGLLTTVQDLGREGFGPIGVSPSGAADPISLRLGNRLVGNAESAAGLEMTLLGGTFLFPQGAILALTGSDFGATLDGAAVALGTSFEVAPGQTVRLGPTRSGARCYLCVHGGIAVRAFSTKRLDAHPERPRRFQRPAAPRKEMYCTSGPRQNLSAREPSLPTISERLSSRKVLRVTPGPQVDWFSESSLRSFYADNVSRWRAIQSHGPSPGRNACVPRHDQGDDYRRRLPRRRSGASRRLAHHLIRGSADHGRLSEDRERNFCRSSSRGTASPSRRDPI